MVLFTYEASAICNVHTSFRLFQVPDPSQENLSPGKQRGKRLFSTQPRQQDDAQSGDQWLPRQGYCGGKLRTQV